MKLKKILVQKAIPVVLVILTFFALSTLLYGILLILSSLSLNYPIILDFRRREPLIGIIVYLKTAIDFTIFMGALMHTNPGWKKRVAIGLGTGLGNAFGTFLILTIWTVARNFTPLIVIFTFLSSIILLRLAQESFEEFLKQRQSFIKLKMPVSLLQDQLNLVNKLFRPILKFFVKDLNLTKTKKLSFINLVTFSFTIPFVLGFTDFSAYIPLYRYINVFGFTLGILLGHTLLTIGLFVLTKQIVSLTRHPVVLIGGGLAFVAIGLFGFTEAIRVILSLL